MIRPTAALLALVALLAACSAPTRYSFPAVLQEPVRQGETPRTVELPADRSVTGLLDATLADILANDQLATTRAFYNANPVTHLALANRGSHYVWPRTYAPQVPVPWSHVGFDADGGSDPGMLGVDVRRLSIEADRAELAVLIFHVGTKNVMGGCFATYSASRLDGVWRVRLVSLRD